MKLRLVTGRNALRFIESIPNTNTVTVEAAKIVAILAD